jgi:hypothetical protein
MSTTNTSHSVRRVPGRQPIDGLKLAAQATTGLVAAVMLISGVLYLIGPRPMMEALRQLGYPAYFLKLLGVAKLLGVVGILAPGRPTLREWAYAGFTFDLVFAIASHAVMSGAADAVPPLVVLALLSSSYVLRRWVADGHVTFWLAARSSIRASEEGP